MLVVVNCGSVTAEVSAVASALHVLPPLGKAHDDVSNFDATLLDYLTVSICRLEADTCTPVQEFTSKDGTKLEHIILEEEEGEQAYHVNWSISRKDLGRQFKIRFLVAGLEVDAIECTPRGQRTVPIIFRIDNHPLIRSYVLCEGGLSAVETAEALIAEFSLTMEDLLPVLMASCFDCVDVSEVLKDIFGLTADDAVLTLIDAGCDCEVLGEALASTFGATADETASILRAGGCECDAVGSVLKNTFDLSPQDAAHILISAGCSCEATGDVLRNTFGLSDEEATPILVAAGCDDYLNLLAPTFAPQLRFDGEADNFPMPAQMYFDSVIVTGRWNNPTWEEMLGEPQLQNTDSDTVILNMVPTYYRAVRYGNQVRIFYWWFYGYQAPCFAMQGWHNGDWEQVMVTLSLDATEVAAVTFWQHSGWYTRLAYSDGQACPPPTSDFDHCGFELFDQTHPVVYVGRIAHGSYANQGGSPDPIMTCLYHYDVRYFTNSALRLDTWANLVNIDAGTETWRQADVQWGYKGIKTSDRTDIDSPPVGNMPSCEGDSWYNPFGTNGCWLSQCRAGDKCNLFFSLAYCVDGPIRYDIRYPIPTTDDGLLKKASAAAIMDPEQMLDLLAMVFDEDSETTGQAERDQSFETSAMVLDESLETDSEEPAVEDDFLSEPESGQDTEMSPDPAVRWPYIAEVARLVLAMTFDINPDQLAGALEDGLTPCQICQAQGMDIFQALAAEWPTGEGIIREAVASEFISPAEADWIRGMLAVLPELCEEEGTFK